ncbi:hypothetical protein EW15_1249 [Prochlorococcus sp. MIT 0801]|nr:hypothetical protein EW15_1249 [Prochlorococcus sp. MIT 0801]
MSLDMSQFSLWRKSFPIERISSLDDIDSLSSDFNKTYFSM